MNRINSQPLLAALAVSVAVAIGASSMSSAQQAPRPLPGNPALNQDRAGPPDRRENSRNNRRDDRLERRLDYLHSELKITPAQQRLWDDFANVVRETANGGPVRGPQSDRDRDGRREAPGILDRLERRQEILTQQNDQLNRIVTALRPLYAALSPDQKRTADRELFQPQGPGFGRGRFTRFDGPRFRPYFDREYR